MEDRFEWIIEVLFDVMRFCAENDLQATEGKLDDAILSALTELSRKEGHVRSLPKSDEGLPEAVPPFRTGLLH